MGPLIKGLYYSSRKPLSEGASFGPLSQWWRNVLSTRDIFKYGLTYLLGNGQLTSFWSDIWVGYASLRTLFPTIYDRILGKNFRVSDCWGVGTGGGGTQFWRVFHQVIK